MAKSLDQKPTQKLEEDDNIFLPDRGIAYGTRTDALRGQLEFIPMPDPSKRGKSAIIKYPWRIALAHPNPSLGVIGLELCDDVVLGRASDVGEQPDLDLSLLDADEQGVSRLHARLRPSNSQLFLIDLGSTNGTLINSVPLGEGMARALHHNDTIAMGDLHLNIKILRMPTDPSWKVERPKE